MTEKREEFTASDGKIIHIRRFMPDEIPRASLLVIHGMAEHSARYARLAAALAPLGLDVWAPDHRGHGLTAAGPDELGHLADRGGFFRVLDDLEEIAEKIRHESPGLALFALGHSMGSLLLQGLMARCGSRFAGVALSATAGPGNPMAPVGAVIASIVCATRGPASRSPFLDSLGFGSNNAAFKPARTRFDWLSRDGAEVDAYVNDPLCGFVCTAAFFRDLAQGLLYVHKREVMEKIPRSLPVYLFAGSRDPVGAAPGTLARLVERYRKMGMADVEVRIYPDGRHESLNETNRDEVTRDLAAWLAKNMGRA
jgi:alpha-beta hydrolase superfamily lysophospholipase